MSKEANTVRDAAAVVGQLEVELAGNPDTFDKYGHLVENCVLSNARPRALHLVELGKIFMASHETSVERKYEFAIALASVWKMERFSKKTADNLRLNITPERKQFLLDAHEILNNLPESEDVLIQHKVMLTLAFVKEGLGLLTESLAILSDLITAEADDSVELAYIIFKAAVILKRLGQSGQALEYLEFLQDDPPSRNAITKTHVLALLTLSFEQGGSKYAVVLQQTYGLLKEAYLEDIERGPNPEATRARVEKQFKQRAIESSSEVWEVLSLQMLDRMEPAFTAELFHQATLKAPTKASLLHSCAEVTYVLNDHERALKYAERAYHLQSQNGDLRNFLLMLDPVSWAEKLRTALPVHNSQQVNAEEEARRLDALGGTKSRVKKKEEPTEASASEDTWLHSGALKPVAKKLKEEPLEPKKNNAADKKDKAEGKKEKKGGKKKKGDNGQDNKADGKKKKKKVSAEAAAKEGVVDIGKATCEAMIGDLETGSPAEKPLSRPVKPAEVSDPEVHKYLRFALCGNDDVHLYDENLIALRDFRISRSKK